MAFIFGRQDNNIRSIKEYPLWCTKICDLVATNSDEIYIRRQKSYFCLTDSIKEINGFKPDMENKLTLKYVESLISNNNSISIVDSNLDSNNIANIDVNDEWLNEKIDIKLEPLKESVNELINEVDTLKADNDKINERIEELINDVDSKFENLAEDLNENYVKKTELESQLRNKLDISCFSEGQTISILIRGAFRDLILRVAGTETNFNVQSIGLNVNLMTFSITAKGVFPLSLEEFASNELIWLGSAVIN